MPAIPAIALAVAAAGTTYSAIAQNQTAQHAKGAAQAQETAMQGQIKAQTDADAAAKKTQAQTSQAGAAQKMAAIMASMTATGGGSGTITGASGQPAATVGQKTLLGT